MVVLFVAQLVIAKRKELTHEEFYKTEMGAYKGLNKSVVLLISPRILQQNHIQSMWYIDYRKVRDTKQSGTHDLFMSIMTVMERGVYFKHLRSLERRWRRIRLLSFEKEPV